jgi:hypothetical protein
MKRNLVLIALAALLLPPVLRGVWFYRGFYRPPEPISTPEYAELALPIPPVGVEAVDSEGSDSSGKTVLIDWGHENRFEITELEGLIGLLTTRGARLEIVQETYDSDYYDGGELSFSGRLKYADAFVVIAPQVDFTDTSVRHVSRFVERGGRLLVISDPTRRQNYYDYDFYDSSYYYDLGDVPAVNSLLKPFDISFSDGFLYNLLQNEGNYRNVLFHEFASDDLTKDLSTVAFYGARPLTTNTGVPLIIGDDDTLSSRTDTGGNLPVAVRSRDGGVVALGDLTFLTPPYHQVADNPLLIGRLVDFLLGGERVRDLTDYPYLFNQPVALLLSDDFSLAVETVGLISRIESAIEARGLALTLVDEPMTEMDLIVLGSFSPSEEILTLLEDFEDLILPEDSEDGTLTAPGFSEVNPAGIGLILYSQTEAGTMLVLLAETADDLLTLAEKLGEHYLHDCLVRGEAALCEIGYGDGFAFDDQYDYGYEDYEFEWDEYNFDDITPTEEPLYPLPTEAPITPTPTALPFPTATPY